MNDTHPAIAVAELMRLLIDENEMDWDTAWRATTQTLSYTNHTLMPEALESGPLPLRRPAPRHLEIIEEINRRTSKTSAPHRRRRSPAPLSIIDGSYVRMAHLATLGSHASTAWLRCTPNCSNPAS